MPELLSDPRRMIGGVVPLTTQSQLASNVYVAVCVDSSLVLYDAFDGLFISLPGRATVHTSHFIAVLALGPLLKMIFSQYSGS